MESFQLIVDSVEGLRELTRQFAEPEPIIIKRGKKEQVRGHTVNVLRFQTLLFLFPLVKCWLYSSKYGRP